MSLPGFAIGTPIFTDSGNLPIEAVRNGARVKTPKGWRKVLVTDVSEGPACVVRLSDGRLVIGHMNALAFSQARGWTPLARLYDGDVMTTEDNRNVGVSSVVEAAVGKMFSLLVSKAAGFFGAGVLLR